MTSVMTNTYAKYLRMGIVPRTVRGNWKDGDYMYSVYHDDVQYTIDDMGDYEIDFDVSYILECLEARQLIIERHHALVSDIYNHIKSKLDCDIWVRINSGMQLSCSFGDYRGAIGTLLLDFVDPAAFETALEKMRKLFSEEFGELPAFEEMQGFVLIVEGCDFSLFDDYKNPIVEIVKFDDLGDVNHEEE